MAKRTRTKKTKQPSRRVRSRRAIKGWETRRRNERRRIRETKRKPPRKAKAKPPRPPRPPREPEEPLRDFVISVSYRSKRGGSRTVDFVATARTREDALQELFKEKPWTKQIPWQKISIHSGPRVKKSRGLLTRLETKPSSSRKRKKSR